MYLVVVALFCLSLVLFFFSVQKLLDAAKYSYILPTHRATIYLVGVVMAYLMKTKKLNYTLSTVSTLEILILAAHFGDFHFCD